MADLVKFRATINRTDKAGNIGPTAHIEIPDEIANQFLEGGNKVRVILTFDNGVKVHRAIQRRKMDGFTFISLGNTTLKEAKARIGEGIEFTIVADKSEFGMPVPEELQELMNQDKEGKVAFMKLNDGNRRSFLYYINTGKTFETRMKRSLKLLDNLKQGIISAGNHHG